MTNPDICSCCGEIWNRNNLQSVNLNDRQLHLCPDCFEAYHDTVFRAFEAGYHKGCSPKALRKTTIKAAFEQWNTG